MNMGKPRRSSQQNAPIKKQQRSPQQQISQQVVHVTEQFSGPLPPPDVLDRYNQVTPDAANRIIAMAEQETGHRRDMERLIISNEYKEARMGQICAVFIGSLTIIAGSVISVFGAPLAGVVIGGCGVIGLVSVFVLGRKGDWLRKQDK